MFENSLPSRLPLRCPEHPKSILTYICTEPRCEGWPLFCEQCRNSYRYKQKHYGHQLSVLELTKGIEQICSKLQREKRAVGVIYREMIGVKGVEGLLKWQQEKEQHFNSIQNHINTIKFQIEEEIGNIIARFQEELHKEKARLYLELQNYYANYRDKFDKFSRLTEPIVAMHSKFKFYASPNSLFFKISSYSGQNKLGMWLSDLKKTLNLTEKATSSPGEYADQIKKYGQQANSIMDDLPRIRNLDYEREMPNLMNGAAQEVLHAMVKLREGKISSMPHRSTSMDNVPLQNDNIPWKHSVNYR